MAYKTKRQHGAAAIFIVVFFAVLISVIVLSFLRIAIQDQQQATNNDLSQSAYDSADAGLEDSKRALSWYKIHCPYGATPAATDQDNCNKYNDTFSTPERCNIVDLLSTGTVPNAAAVAGTSEVKVSTNSSPGSDDTKLDQAYTCVTVTTQTKDYKATASNGKSDTLIPLRTVNNEPIDTIELNWFTEVNAGSTTPTFPTGCSAALPQCLPEPSNWPATTPPIMRFQLIPVLRDPAGFSINDLDADSRTAMLYPRTSGSGTVFLSEDSGFALPADSGRYNEKSQAPNPVKCKPTLPTGTYGCSVKIQQLPLPSSGGTPTNTDYYLRVMALYNNADYQVRLYGNGGADLRLFDNVEPEVDSTGRANDVFRRVQSRVRDLTSSNPLTDGGFDLTQGLCKDFNVPVYDTDCDTQLINP